MDIVVWGEVWFLPYFPAYASRYKWLIAPDIIINWVGFTKSEPEKWVEARDGTSG